ncbi:hypothetical protein OAN13_06295 [Opitutales bacterium]|nr:hypothetical protein [Opitutales bacterium]
MNKSFNNLYVSLLLICFGGDVQAASNWKVAYEQNFEKIEEGRLPDDFFVLDGRFSVQERNARKCLILPGNPVGEFGFLFGPRFGLETMELSFSCLGGFKSRRHSAFSGAIGGIRGLHYRINPSSRRGILSYLDDWKHDDHITWESKEWMRVCIKIVPQPAKQGMLISLKTHLESESTGPNEGFTTFLKGTLSGKCALWGFSYAEKEMRWDDILILTRL